jgi:hypothetical protein
MPIRVRLGGVEHDFDLGLPEHETELLGLLRKRPMDEVVAAYRKIQKTAASSEAVTAGHLRAVLRRITMQSEDRGFVPRDNEVYRDCLRYVRLDPENILTDEPLRPLKEEVDIRPIVQPYDDIDPEVQRTFEERFKGFAIETLQAIDSSLGNASLRARPNEALQYATILPRLWLYDLTCAWGLDLRPDITQHLGRKATPDEYRDQYIPLARKAEAAARAAMEADPPEQHQTEAKTRKARKRYADDDYFHQQKLIRLYRERITAQITAAEAMVASARTRRQLAETTRRNHVFQDEHEAAELALDRLRKKLKAFEAAPYDTIISAPKLDFLPATVTEEHVAPPRSQKHLYSEAAGYRPRDKAREMFEDLLLGEFKPPSRPAKSSEPTAVTAPARRPAPVRELE